MPKRLQKSGEERARGMLFVAAGVALVLVAFCLTAYNVYEGKRAGLSSARVVQQIEASSGQAFHPIPLSSLHPTLIIDGRDYIGVLRIPSLDLKLPVLSEWSYAGLRVAPCLYAGSSYSGDMVVAAHNYSSHFGRLRELTYGSEVSFADTQGNVFVYEVVSIEELGPRDVDAMTEDGAWDLTMFTCTLGGGSRVTVRCCEVAPVASGYTVY